MLKADLHRHSKTLPTAKTLASDIEETRSVTSGLTSDPISDTGRSYPDADVARHVTVCPHGKTKKDP